MAETHTGCCGREDTHYHAGELMAHVAAERAERCKMSKHTRLWDSNWNLLYDSETDPRTIEQFMLDRALTEANISIDNPDVGRQTGRVTRTADGTFTPVGHFDPSRYFAMPDNPSTAT